VLILSDSDHLASLRRTSKRTSLREKMPAKSL